MTVALQDSHARHATDGDHADRCQIEPSRSLGDLRPVTGPHDGFDIEFFRTVTRPGGKPVRERFFHGYDVGDHKVLGNG